MVSDTSIDRRTALSGIAGTLTTVTGCATIGTRGEQSAPVSLLAAGSLNSALENGLRQTVETPLQIEARGSAAIARLVEAGQKDPDIVSLADVALFEDLLQPAWFAEFATNSIVIAYNPETEGGQRLAEAGADGWYRPLLDDTVSIGRTDPALDPLGYRTLFVLERSSEYYGLATDLREAIPTREQLYPETQLISQFETGSIDAAFAYRNMAVERGYEYIQLPAAVDFSDPAYTETYATVSYTLPSGTVVQGRPISYGTTIRQQSPVVRDVFDTHITGEYLSEFGFVVPGTYPRFTDNAPTEVTG